MLLLQCVNRNRNAFTTGRGESRGIGERIEMKLCGRCVFFCFKCALFFSILYSSVSCSVLFGSFWLNESSNRYKAIEHGYVSL